MSNPQPASRRSGPAPATRFVYFIEAEGLGLVKIGVADDPKKRLRTLQVGCPVPLKLRGVFATDDAHRLEGGFHLRFTEIRVQGEWFKITDELREIMDGGLDDAGSATKDSQILFKAEPGPKGWSIEEFGLSTEELIAESMADEEGGPIAQAVADLSNLIAHGRSVEVLKRKAPWQWRKDAERLGM